MGNALLKSTAVEEYYESYHLNQYLDLYQVIADSVSLRRRFTLRHEHLAILTLLEENIDTLLEAIEPHVTSLELYPYRRRYTSAKTQLTTHLRQLFDKDALEGEEALLRAMSVL